MTQTTLNGSDIVSTAISRLREHEPNGGYRLAFSGGKALERAVDKYLETHPNTTIIEWGGSGRDIVYRWVHESPIESAKGQCLGNFQGVGVE